MTGQPGAGAAEGIRLVDHVELRRGAYRDSVALMLATQRVAAVAGVAAAQLVMATELNLSVLAELGFTAPEGASPNDLVLAVRGSPDAVQRAQAEIETVLRPAVGSPAGGGPGVGPDLVGSRTVGHALAGSDASLALISVPGRYALAEAMDALHADRHVMIFSDNVPVEDEMALKTEAVRRGLLVMGPDCGTAIVGGVGLGFANVVRPGSIGIVAASGTGAQQVACLLDAAGAGVSQLLGVGGRDLSAAVGGVSTLQALAALDADPSTERIVLVSKPADPAVAERVRRAADQLSTRVHLALVGPGQPDLTKAVAAVLHAAGMPVPDWSVFTRPAPQPAPASVPERTGAALRGLFSGGTLAEEAMVVAAARLGPIRSNVPLAAELALPPTLRAAGHLVIDFGADTLTRGRAHPMIDPTLRLARIAVEAADPSCAVLLLDVVLGYAADPDPAATLAPALAAARSRAWADGRQLTVAVSLVGTAGDPQGFDRQAAALREAGAAVFLSNAAAARYAAAASSGGTVASSGDPASLGGSR